MMTAEQLKGSILQLAMQGKLVEQDSSDGSASPLIREIAKKKEALIKQGVIKKEKELSIISEEEIPFDIPNTWEWIRLGDYAEKVTDYVASGSFASLRENAPSLKTEDYAILVKTADFANNFTRNLTYTTKHGYEFLSNSNLFGGELVLSNIGSIGKVFIVPKLDRKMTLAPNSVMVRLTSEELRDFLYYFFMSPLGYAELMAITSGTAMKKFNKTDLKTVLIPIPPLAEQKRIVAKIEELRPFVEKYAVASTKLNTLNASFPEMMKKSILQEAVQGKLVPQDPNDEPASVLIERIRKEKERLIKEGKIKKQKPLPEISEEEIPFDIPESWEWVRFAQVINIESNLVKPENYQDLLQIAPDNIGKGSGLLLQKRTVRESGVKSPNHLFHKGQILYSKIRPALRKVVEAPADGLCSADMYPLGTQLNKRYVIFYILSDLFTKAVTSNDNRVKMPKVNQEELSNVLIPVPPSEEQKRIVTRAEELMDSVNGFIKVG